MILNYIYQIFIKKNIFLNTYIIKYNKKKIQILK